MPQPATRISVEEYLRTSYEGPDREYVDGVVVERSVGEKSHSRMQRNLIAFFHALAKTVGTVAFPEQRIQVKRTRLRIPDVCVYIGKEPDEEIFTIPPFLAIEILLRGERRDRLMQRIDDDLAFGVPYIWVIDPLARRAHVHTKDGPQEAKDGILRTANPVIEARLTGLLA